MSDDLRERLDAYLDGQLDDAARGDFEARLAQDPALRAEVELQRRIDGAVRRAATPPDADALLARARAAAAEPAGRVVRGPWLVRGLALAAAALLVALALRLGVGGDGEYALREVAAIYEARVQAGFQPDWVCKDEQEFVDSFQARLGRPVRLAALPPGVTARGLAYEPALSRSTVAILVLVEERPVLVLVDRLERDRPLALPEGSPLRVHRREQAGLVLYEVTPLGEPRVLSFVQTP